MLLGGQPNLVSAGELWHRRGYPSLRHLACSCGRPAGECALWGAVIGRLEERFGPTGLQELEQLERQVHSWIKVPTLLGIREAHSRPELEELSEYVTATYEYLIEVSGASVVVDSSKWPFHLGALGLCEGVEPYALHLVRDPRGVAYSWQKNRGVSGGLPTYGAIHSGVSWLVRNLGSEKVKRRSQHFTLRYEDLASEPAGTLEEIMRWVDESQSVIGPAELELDPHILAGNPVKSTGLRQIEVDEEWRVHLPRSSRAVTWLLCGWLAKRYGYGQSSRTRVRS